MVFGTGSVTAKHARSLRIALPVRHSQTMTCAMGELCPFENAKGRILTHGKAGRIRPVRGGKRPLYLGAFQYIHCGKS